MKMPQFIPKTTGPNSGLAFGEMLDEARSWNFKLCIMKTSCPGLPDRLYTNPTASSRKDTLYVAAIAGGHSNSIYQCLHASLLPFTC